MADPKGKQQQQAPKDDKKITHRPDYSQWYLDIVRRAEMAENSDVAGCMVIKPNGYALWENMQRTIDGLFKATGHVNAYLSFSSSPRASSRRKSKWPRDSPRNVRLSRITG